MAGVEQMTMAVPPVAPVYSWKSELGDNATLEVALAQMIPLAPVLEPGAIARKVKCPAARWHQFDVVSTRRLEVVGRRRWRPR
jgi:hypothetical protein